MKHSRSGPFPSLWTPIQCAWLGWSPTATSPCALLPISVTTTNTQVEDVMSKDIVMCRVDDDYNEVIDAMKEHQIRRIPVVYAKKQLCGIIALADVARQAPDREEVGVVVERISKPGMLQHNGRAHGGAVYNRRSACRRRPRNWRRFDLFTRPPLGPPRDRSC